MGKMPLAGGFIKSADISKERSYPLRLGFCTDCKLLQLIDNVSAQTLFGKTYPFLSQNVTGLAEHFHQFAIQTINKLHLHKSDLVIDIGSNDGSLLLEYKSQGMKIFGIEPAPNVVKIAESKGVPTVLDFFSPAVGLALSIFINKATLITSTNSFAHIEDYARFFKGLDFALANTGTFVVEVPYVPQMIMMNDFSTIYHEHKCYFSLTSLQNLFHRYGWYINDAELLTVHGGSIRVYVSRNDQVTANILTILNQENLLGINDIKSYYQFASRIQNLRATIQKQVKILAKTDKIGVYGASARGNVILNYCKLGRYFSFVVDNTPAKIGLLTPGTHIKVINENKWKRKNRFMFLTAWTWINSIKAKEKAFIASGGVFIVPLPELQFVGTKVAISPPPYASP